MLDPKEQAKGGFGARAAREQERQHVLEASRREADAEAGSTGDTPGMADGWADGTPSDELPDTDGRRSPAAPSAGRQPKRWH
jgi:hypothetical protein